MHDKISIHRTNSQLIYLEKSRLGAAIQLGIFIGMIFLIYKHLFELPELNAFHYLFFIAPAGLYPQIRELIDSCKIAKYSVDSKSRSVQKNKSVVARYDEISAIQIREINNPEHANEYRISLVLKAGGKTVLFQTEDEESASDCASEISRMIGVEITRK